MFHSVPRGDDIRNGNCSVGTAVRFTLMRCTSLLSNEHKAIQRGLRLLRTVAPRAARGDRESIEDALTLLDFFREFLDHCHFLKEETLLFPRMRKHMPGGSGSLTMTLLEHDQIRAVLHNMRNALDGQPAQFGLYAERLGQLLAGHIGKEDKALFPKVQSLLSEQDDEEMTTAFEAVETRLGEDVNERFYRILESLEERYLPGLEKAG